MGFTIPNYTDAVATYEVGDQAEPDSVDFQVLGNPANCLVQDSTNFAFNGRVRPSETISNSVRVDPYKVIINGIYYTNTTASTVNIGEGGANPRFDLLVVRATSPTVSALTVIPGTADAANPLFPQITDNDVVLAAIYRSGVGIAGYISTSHIVDKRIFLLSNKVWVKDFNPVTNTDGSATSAKIGDLWLDTTATGAGQSMLWVKQAASSWKNLSSYIAPASTNTPSTLVQRDASGNFTANTITANLVGTVTGNVTGSSGSTTGNAATATSATSATLAVKASTLSQGGGNGTAMTFNWSGQSGQPTWLWGSNDGSNHYVYNPSNFSVAYATNAANATNATNATNADNLDNYSSSITGEPNTIALVDGIGILSAKYFGMGVSNATFWVATTYAGDTIFRAVGNTGVYGQAVGTSGTRAVYVNSSGTLGVASTSSRKYKENIVPYVDLTNKLLNVSPVIFDYKTGVLESDHDNDRFNQFGLIAEEMHDAGLTHLVSYDKQGNPDGISYERISLELLSVVKNLNEKIKVLEARVDELEDK